jgi:hypothetical protein
MPYTGRGPLHTLLAEAKSCHRLTGRAVDRSERLGHAPRQDSSREVIDHGVRIGACPVKQANYGRVDVPHRVRAGRAQPHLRLRRMHAKPRASPAVLPDEVIPGRRRRGHGAEPLREDGERAGRDVTVVGEVTMSPMAWISERVSCTRTSDRSCTCHASLAWPMVSGRGGIC